MSFPVISRGRLWYVPAGRPVGMRSWAGHYEQDTGYGESDGPNYATPAQRGNPHQNGQRGDPHQGERGAGPDHRFYRGDRLLPEYRSRYVVDDGAATKLVASPPASSPAAPAEPLTRLRRAAGSVRRLHRAGVERVALFAKEKIASFPE